MSEDYKASLQVAPPTTGTRFHNAAVEGATTVIEAATGFALWLLEAGPSLPPLDHHSVLPRALGL